MILSTALLSVLFLLVTSVTFVLWMKPLGEREMGASAETWVFLRTLSAVLFFLACFALGVWFSILRLRGEFWKL